MEVGRPRVHVGVRSGGAHDASSREQRAASGERRTANGERGGSPAPPAVAQDVSDSASAPRRT
ncbi:hypothetical protein E5U26_32925 [Burkholderia pseudomallei]|nr:hypothetical protein [Burkholderia pseudomallei]NRE35258.1 hypothetical protein [Burkholderia pseudomallei]